MKYIYIFFKKEKHMSDHQKELPLLNWSLVG